MSKDKIVLDKESEDLVDKAFQDWLDGKTGGQQDDNEDGEEDGE